MKIIPDYKWFDISKGEIPELGRYVYVLIDGEEYPSCVDRDDLDRKAIKIYKPRELLIMSGILWRYNESITRKNSYIIK